MHYEAIFTDAFEISLKFLLKAYPQSKKDITNLIQYVENLSKKGIMALESKSYKDSLNNYDQIMNLIQGYNKQIQGKVG